MVGVWHGSDISTLGGAFGATPHPRRLRGMAGSSSWESVAEAGLPLDDQLLVGLRRREGVTLQGLDVDALVRRWQPFVERGWLQQRAGRWCLTDPEGMALSNQVLIEVILWWEGIVKKSGESENPQERPG